MASEYGRLHEAREQHVPWRKWGPYLSERQWGVALTSLTLAMDGGPAGAGR